MSETQPSRTGAGPVLTKGPLTEAVIRALRALNDNLTLIDRGSYVRVFVPGRCVLTSKAVELYSDGRFQLPGDLEAIMPAFKGRLCLTEDQAVWELAEAGPP